MVILLRISVLMTGLAFAVLLRIWSVSEQCVYDYAADLSLLPARR